MICQAGAAEAVGGGDARPDQPRQSASSARSQTARFDRYIAPKKPGLRGPGPARSRAPCASLPTQRDATRATQGQLARGSRYPTISAMLSQRTCCEKRHSRTSRAVQRRLNRRQWIRTSIAPTRSPRQPSRAPPPRSARESRRSARAQDADDAPCECQGAECSLRVLVRLSCECSCEVLVRVLVFMRSARYACQCRAGSCACGASPSGKRDHIQLAKSSSEPLRTDAMRSSKQERRAGRPAPRAPTGSGTPRSISAARVMSPAMPREQSMYRVASTRSARAPERGHGASTVDVDGVAEWGRGVCRGHAGLRRRSAVDEGSGVAAPKPLSMLTTVTPRSAARSLW